MTRSAGSVLVVDDDDDIRELVTMVLSARGYRVGAAADGLRALEELRRDPPDLILLDLRMPGMAGDELVDVLRGELGLVDVAIVVMSGDSTACQRAADLPVQGCLLKPVQLSELLSTVSQFADR